MDESLKKHGFKVIKSFIDPSIATDLADDFVKYAGLHGESDSQSNCPSVYNHLPFVRMLVHKTPHASVYAGESLLPTYTYARHYNTQGSILEKHTDRDACEISLTVNLRKTEPWLFHLTSRQNEDFSIDLDSGDAVMYAGCDVPHWRDAYSGFDHVQVFLHYVLSHGDRSWAVFDQQRRSP